MSEKEKSMIKNLQRTILLQKKVILQLIKVNNQYQEIIFTIVTGDDK